MTLGLGLVGDGFIVVAADKQQTMQYEVGTYTQQITKIREISPSIVCVCAGLSSLEEWIGAAVESKKPTLVSDNFVLSLCSFLQQQYEAKLGGEGTSPQYTSSVLLAGFDTEGEPILYTFSSPSFLQICDPKFRAIGSGQQSTYFLNLLYSQSLPSVEVACLLSCFCINETAKQNRLVGRDMDIWVLRKGGGIEKLPQSKIEQYRVSAESIADKIRELFK